MSWLSGTSDLNRAPPLGHTRCMWSYTHSSSGPGWWHGPITFPLENHSFWIPQMPAGCQGGGVGHDAVGSSSCRGWQNLLCLHILPGFLAGWLWHTAPTSCRAKPKKVCVYTFRLRCIPPPWWLQSKLRLRWPLGVELTCKVIQVLVKWQSQWSQCPLFLCVKAWKLKQRQTAWTPLKPLINADNSLWACHDAVFFMLYHTWYTSLMQVLK